MEDRRSLVRFPAKLKAIYNFQTEDDREGLAQCSILDVSYKGLGVNFHQHEINRTGSLVHLEIPLIRQPNLITAKGTIRWFEERAYGFVCGIELAEAFNSITLIKLL